MHCIPICGFTGAGGIGSRGDLLVGCGHVCGGNFLSIDCLLPLTCDSKVFVLFL